ncbi:MAG: epoxyqueuosine reductase, partial [Caldilineaceae bacterium]
MSTSSDSHQTTDAAHESANPQDRGPAGLSAMVKERARELGFDLCRIVPVDTAMHINFFDLWLSLGRAGEMTYLEDHMDKRHSPVRLSPKNAPPFRSIIIVAISYHQFELPDSIRNDPSRGLIASYAWTDDYHEIIRPLLYEIDAAIRVRTGRTTIGKCLVDTGPVLERDWAQRAGIGFTGKNCCTINPQYGSWLFLATILVPEALHYDKPVSEMEVPTDADVSPQAVASGLAYSDHFGSWQIPVESNTALHGAEDASRLTGTCGHCSRCLNDCPTGAFVGPFHLDPQRCISYWTIEARSPIPQTLRASFANRIFGCDICQEVCPWNRRIPERSPLVDGLRA